MGMALQAQIFELLVPSWLTCLGRVRGCGLIGGLMSLERALRSQNLMSGPGSLSSTSDKM